MARENSKPYMLGLDLGVQSVGWAVIDLDDDGRPCGVRRSGVRCFDSGVGSETEIASGKDESQNIKRRQARLQRRQLWRRGRRLKKVFHLLAESGALAAGRSPHAANNATNSSTSSMRNWRRRTFPNATAWPAISCRIGSAAWPSIKRCRRSRSAGRCSTWPSGAGFLSNRKSPPRTTRKPGEVKAGIGEL